MPRDLRRLAAPAVFCSNVRRSYRRRSPHRNISRQRDRLLDDHESEYDDYAAEIASYNRLRRGDRNAANSASAAPRHTVTYEYSSRYGDSTGIITPQSDARYVTPHFENDYIRGSVSTNYHVPHISDEYIRPSVGRIDRDDSQQRKHKKKRRHHHCHSRNKTDKHSENGSTGRPTRDTVAALKALANYGDTNYDVTSVSPMHYYGSPRNSERKRSRESQSPRAVCNMDSEVTRHVTEEKAVTVSASLLPPTADCTRDSLSLGECTDDEDDVPTDTHSMQKSHRSDHRLPHAEHSERDGKSAANLSEHLSASVVSSSESTKKLNCDSVHQTEDSSMQFHQKTSNSDIPNAMSSLENKAHKEQLPVKCDKSSSDRSEGQSTGQLKHSPVNKRTTDDDRSKTISDGKHSTKHKSQSSSESSQNSRKKSTTGDDQRKAEDDTSLPRFVTFLDHPVIVVRSPVSPLSFISFLFLAPTSSLPDSLPVISIPEV